MDLVGHSHKRYDEYLVVRFEIFMAVTMKNSVF
jgi:hypothetical protein